jgi:small-conductance mechanosensitive channel
MPFSISLSAESRLASMSMPRPPAGGGSRRTIRSSEAHRCVVRLLRVLAGVVLAVTVAVAAAAESGPDASDWTPTTTKEWERTFKRVEAYLRAPGASKDQPEELAVDLDLVIGRARGFTEQARQAVETETRLLHALGTPPAEGTPPELPEVAQRRADMNDSLARLRARQSEAEFAIARAKELQNALADQQRRRLVEVLTQRTTTPIPFGRIDDVLAEFGDSLVTIAGIPAAWYRDLAPDQRTRVWAQWRMLVFLGALVAAFAARRFLLRRFGPDPAIADPSYARRFVAAVAEAVAKGVMPAALLFAVFIRVQSDEKVISGAPADIVANAALALIAIILIHAFSAAILRPDLPSWRLTSLTYDSARRLHWRLMFLALVFVADQFLRHVKPIAGIVPSADLIRFYALAVVCLEALGVVLLTRAGVWRLAAGEDGSAPAADVPAPSEVEGGRRPRRINLLRIGREILAIAALAGVAAFLAGYLRLGLYLVDNTVLTLAVLGGALLVRALFRDLIELLSAAAVPARLRLLPHAVDANLIRFGAFPLLDLLLVVGGLYVAAPSWGLSRDVISRWVGAFLSGFTVGGVTISLTDLALAIAVFVVVLVVVRSFRGALTERVLSQTRLDLGIRNSISVGIGYVGFVIAFLLAVSILGLNLSNLAIVAGALSVGIGFGLQNIVNNFVSGLILLVERPIKVGDWVVLGDKEGHVRRINVRSTEIETFDRSSLIVPNSDIVSTALVNWTHKDRLGRVIICVGVAYGSDTGRVRDVLLECAKAHPEILSWPKPVVLLQNFGDSSLDFELRAFLRDVDKRLSVASDLRFAIDEAFRREGIDIPFPQRVLRVQQADPLAGHAAEAAARDEDRVAAPSPRPVAVDAGPPAKPRQTR